MTKTAILIKPLGGIAGDMFVGACASLWPDLKDTCLADLRDAGVPETVQTGFEPVMVNGFASTKFTVSPGGPVVPTGDYAKIVETLRSSCLDTPVLTIALDILRLLGEAEAKVHGKPLDHVHFHELADWDSVADIVAAASFIARAGVSHWYTSTVPMGGGSVKTQHGIITVPAPAVLGLLQGFDFEDDGIMGERVTPTGAAILRYLTDPAEAWSGGALKANGFGAGTKRFDNLANVVQLLAFEASATHTDRITELSFDIDDMTPEELGTATDRLRAADGVLDVTQTQMIGKKGRAIFCIRLLCRPEMNEQITQSCFAETTTLGLRVTQTERRTLDRHAHAGAIRVKSAARPNGPTAKAESDDLAATPTLKARREHARRAEVAALEAADD